MPVSDVLVQDRTFRKLSNSKKGFCKKISGSPGHNKVQIKSHIIPSKNGYGFNMDRKVETENRGLR